jgi:hypothetical protein
MSLPQDTLTADDGEIYILDWNNHRLRRLADGELHWVAGRGELGGSIDDPENGDFNHPTNIIFDPTGDEDHHGRVAQLEGADCRSAPPALVTDTCGDGKRAYFGDDGPPMASSLDLPASLAYDPAGNLVIMDQANQVLRYVDGANTIHLLAGRCVDRRGRTRRPRPLRRRRRARPVPRRPAAAPRASTPAAIRWRVLEALHPWLRGRRRALPPSCACRSPSASRPSPAGRIVYDKAGNLYFADTANNLIRMIDAEGSSAASPACPPGRRPAERLLRRRRPGPRGQAQLPRRPRLRRRRHPLLHRRTQPLRARDRQRRHHQHRRRPLRRAGL